MKLTKQNYYSKKANLEYMSVSQFKSFEQCQHSALGEINGQYEREETEALLVGSYIDSYFEGTLNSFIKKNYKKLFNNKDKPYAFVVKANEIIKRIEQDKLFMEHLSGKKQVIMTGNICGVPIKIKMDSFQVGKQIDDLKIVKDFQPIFDPERGLLPWFEYWEYDMQGAVYQEIVRQNTGERIPFYLDAATKEKTTDIDIVHLTQRQLDVALDRFKRDVEMYDAIKKGVIEPERCEKCEYCKISKVLTVPTESDEFYLL